MGTNEETYSRRIQKYKLFVNFHPAYSSKKEFRHKYFLNLTNFLFYKLYLPGHS